MPPNSTDRFLTVPIRAVKSFKKHLHLASCQEPIRRPFRLPRPLRLSRTPGPPKPLKLSGQLGQLKQLRQLE